jgi:hypothetical protein
MKKITLRQRIDYIHSTAIILKDIIKKSELHNEFREYLLFVAGKKINEIIDSAVGIKQQIQENIKK